MKKVGIFGGTFNPVHFGHIHLALSLKEAAELDVIYFSPNYASPFKKKADDLISGEHRLEMLNIALQEIPGCKVLDYEVSKKGPSYTIDLVKHIKENLCDFHDRIYLLLGEDLIETFHLWKEVDLLLSLVTPLVGSRKRGEGEVNRYLEKGRVEIPLMEISSSQIRERVKNGLYTGHLVSEKVLDYIYLNKLYL